MKRFLRYIFLSAVLFSTVGYVTAQTQNWREMHKVKKKETIFGIARDYGITIEELINANPEMKLPSFELKKGDFIRIPYPKKQEQQAATDAQPQPEKPQAKDFSDVRNRAIRLGVMLPLHNINGDGRRMVEYYRGVLMACDSLRKEGISVDVHAWNTAEDSDIAKILKDNKAAAKCDIILGPLYSKQMNALSDFVSQNNIKLVIPFSIDAPQLFSNRNIFQVYQTASSIHDNAIQRFVERFKDTHPVFIDCNDTTSRKGDFTFRLRRKLEIDGIEYKISNLKSGDALFAKAFSTTKRNVVVLNTGRAQELTVAVARLNSLLLTHPSVKITLFGYPEWLQYTKNLLESYYKLDTYIPTPYYFNPLTAQSNRFEQQYRANFHTPMQSTVQRFAAAGFDHALFFLRGLHKYGDTFSGEAGVFGYQPLQAPLKFERIGNGGSQNRTLILVHYQPDHQVEAIRF